MAIVACVSGKTYAFRQIVQQQLLGCRRRAPGHDERHELEANVDRVPLGEVLEMRVPFGSAGTCERAPRLRRTVHGICCMRKLVLQRRAQLRKVVHGQQALAVQRQRHLRERRAEHGCTVWCGVHKHGICKHGARTEAHGAVQKDGQRARIIEDIEKRRLRGLGIVGRIR